MRYLSAAIVLVLASLCHAAPPASNPDDEAYQAALKRIQARQDAAKGQPTKRDEELAQMREDIALLMRRNEALKQQNILLEKMLADSKGETVAAKAQEEAAIETIKKLAETKRVVRGMTKLQVEAVIGKGAFLSEDDDGNSIYVWELGPGKSVLSGEDMPSDYVVRGYFKDGRLMSAKITR